ncbi:hypothetical protein [Actinoalloteichus hymeniacidonis]|uniref:Uncharacterized protein n=1 Tax=Actinoalloteichus hymeniacidonis TaxID=340345 RepID=A0AAC9HPS8_9PSEU|nr:hypothetical protein [Actinoalloteichus hymeniacidonis]AOS63190.1 hypothetical protein TL08_11880 [Actinoalloteichus hymeniacidonis]MBB5908773.1 hypothetical protein [Actinoalloteichus hymeniacidonis]
MTGGRLPGNAHASTGSAASADALEQVAAAVLGSAEYRSAELLDVLDGRMAERLDVVRVGDDVLPQLAHEGSVSGALAAARRALRAGGLVVAAVPELSGLRSLRPTAPPPRVTGAGEDRQITVQLWDWSEDGTGYGLEVVRLHRRDGDWEVAHSTATRHRVLARDQIAQAFQIAGFVAVQRLSPGESGHPLPVWVAVAPR